MIQAGDALLIPSGPQGHHLFIVLNAPGVLPGYGAIEHCVLANISSIKPGIPHDPKNVLGGPVYFALLCPLQTVL